MRRRYYAYRNLFVLIVLPVLMILPGCASLGPNTETPTVVVSSFRALPSSGALPEFSIGLRVINPNRQALNFYGASYSISLDGHEIIKGVARDLPVVEGYGQADFNVTASPNLIAGIRLLNDLINNSRDTVAYEFEARLDSGTFRRKLRIIDRGEVSLGNTGR